MKLDPSPDVPAVPDFTVPEREGGYARGKAGHERILRAALDILIEEGYRALTMRRIAARCGLRPGNLSYYFPTKDALVRDLLEAIISSYEAEFGLIVADVSLSPEARLEKICVLIMEDIGTKKTTRIFPELWALSNHDGFVNERLQELYDRARVSLELLIAMINPALPLQARKDLSLFISASMEGLTVFAGYEKPFRGRMPALERIATRSFLHMVKTLGPKG
ncbi:MAG: TetR/AcrR family transcriptional regulator [Polymorphobacter sp.]|uniref:TetR/AcrR family transcriptional regulator n=1 Tax=Polymorphobacter sp. TaxID=1909290 RepID=UPI003A8BA5F1